MIQKFNFGAYFVGISTSDEVTYAVEVFLKTDRWDCHKEGRDDFRTLYMAIAFNIGKSTFVYTGEVSLDSLDKAILLEGSVAKAFLMDSKTISPRGNITYCIVLFSERTCSL